MSHLLDQLRFFNRKQDEFSDGHGETRKELDKAGRRNELESLLQEFHINHIARQTWSWQNGRAGPARLCRRLPS